MKRLFLWVLLILGICAGSLFIWRDAAQFVAMRFFLQPRVSFEESQSHPAPIYANLTAWATHPALENGADFVPSGLPTGETSKGAAVFFVHGTTFLSAASWNGAPDDPAAASSRDTLVMRAQASAFNLCCEVYAPKYRQATFWSFVEPSPEADAAKDLAFKDVSAAFETFLEDIKDAPFVLAGHSQGSHHLLRLLEAHTDDTRLSGLVAAYLVGVGIDPRQTARLPVPVCETPDQTGCFVTWNALSADAIARATKKGDVCVNPLTWRTAMPTATKTANLGALSVADSPRLVPAFTDASCLSDRLRVGPFATDMFDDTQSLGPGNYHLLDYSLFYANIRRNAKIRVEAATERRLSSRR